MLPLVPEVLLAEDRVDRMLEDQARQWWERQNLHETGMSLSQVVLDYQFQVCAYIVQRLRDPATSARRQPTSSRAAACVAWQRWDRPSLN